MKHTNISRGKNPKTNRKNINRIKFKRLEHFPEKEELPQTIKLIKNNNNKYSNELEDDICPNCFAALEIDDIAPWNFAKENNTQLNSFTVSCIKCGYKENRLLNNRKTNFGEK